MLCLIHRWLHTKAHISLQNKIHWNNLYVVVLCILLHSLLTEIWAWSRKFIDDKFLSDMDPNLCCSMATPSLSIYTMTTPTLVFCSCQCSFLFLTLWTLFTFFSISALSCMFIGNKYLIELQHTSSGTIIEKLCLEDGEVRV